MAATGPSQHPDARYPVEPPNGGYVLWSTSRGDMAMVREDDPEQAALPDRWRKVDGNSRFASGYQLAYNNVWYATHARVAAALDTVAPAATATVSARGDRCWRSAPPVPPSPTPVDPRPVPAGPFPTLARQWATGLALGAAHGALHAAHDLRSTLLRLPHAMPGVRPDGLDAALRHVLATTVPVWADHLLADWATSMSRDRAPSPSPPSLKSTSMAHPGNQAPPPRTAPTPAPAGPLTPPTPAHQRPPLTTRHHRRNL